MLLSAITEKLYTGYFLNAVFADHDVWKLLKISLKGYHCNHSTAIIVQYFLATKCFI